MRLCSALLLMLVPVLSACGRSAGLFSERNARAHVEMLAGAIGSRPVGTEPNARARSYIVDQLRLYGYEVRVQETDARRAAAGVTTRVANIVAVLPGARTEAVGVLSHYDSRFDTPGAADDGFGVAVTLEAARVLAARSNRTWSTYILVTDGEEVGLMGAAGLMADRDVTDRLRAYINLEAIGSAGPAELFETGPGNGWIVRPWARHAPHPEGGSYAVAIYERLPNDTDFTILKRNGIPGLNFALVGDSYAYHTPRDTPDRLSDRALRAAGDNVVAIVTAFDGVDITQRTSAGATYFDIAGSAGVSYGPLVWWLSGAASLLLGALAWLKVTAAALRLGGAVRWLLTAVWSIVGLALAAATMAGATWVLRAAREVYHPWYARPGRLFLLLLVCGASVAWAVSRLGVWLPARAHGLRHPAMTWSVTLPLWMITASVAVWLAPDAAFLWTWPLLAAAVLLLVAPSRSTTAIRVASLVIAAVAATLWLPDTVEFLRFLVAVFGRLPIITPAFPYAAVIALAALVVAPPLIAALGATRPLLRPAMMTIACLIAIAATLAYAYVAPAYTREQPLRRSVRAIQDGQAQTATWEVASVEPGLDLLDGAPGGWALQNDAPAASLPVGRFPHPFVFRASGPALGEAPVRITEFTVAPVAAGSEILVSVVPEQAGLTLVFTLPPGLVPARSTLPGRDRAGRWAATYHAPPAEGVSWRASFGGIEPARLRNVWLMVSSGRMPGGEGWQQLPRWLPQERTVWSATAAWLVSLDAARPSATRGPAVPLAPVPPLR